MLYELGPKKSKAQEFHEADAILSKKNKKSKNVTSLEEQQEKKNVALRKLLQETQSKILQKEEKMKKDEAAARSAAGLNPTQSGRVGDLAVKHHDGVFRRGKPLEFNPNAMKYLSKGHKAQLVVPKGLLLPAVLRQNPRPLKTRKLACDHCGKQDRKYVSRLGLVGCSFTCFKAITA